MYSLKGKAAILTGAARKQGIGSRIALRLGEEGADVAVCDWSQTGIRYIDDGNNVKAH